MDSHPPLRVEDHTDEDTFFDKLANDDDDDDDIDLKSASDLNAASTDAGLLQGNQPDDAEAFANLSIGEVQSGEDVENDHSRGELGVEGSGEGKEDVSVSGNVEACNDEVVAGGHSGLDSVVEGNNSSVDSSDCTMVSKSSGSGSTGIKEVGWSAFNADDSGQDDSNGFGSFSDFFTGLGENAGDSVGDFGGNATAEVSEPSQSAYTGVSNSYDHHYQAGFGTGTAAEQGNVAEDMNSSQYWENLYPGWKFDPATGQWYQVDGNDYSTSVQESNPAFASSSDGNSEISYLQKSPEAFSETKAECGRTETVTNLNQVSQFSGLATTIYNQNQISQETESAGVASGWNQASQVDSGYPSNMVFDPQYPGWYYDTISQEWKSLDSYTASAQSAIQGQDQLSRNEFIGSNCYSHNDVQKTYGNYEQANPYPSSQSFSTYGQDYNWGGSRNSCSQPASGVWEPERVIKNETAPNYDQRQQNHYKQDITEINHVSQPEPDSYQASGLNYGKVCQVQSDFPAVSRSHSFVSGENVSQQFSHPRSERRSHSSDFGEDFTQQFNHLRSERRSHSFVAGENFTQQFNHSTSEQTEHKVASNEYFGSRNSPSFSQRAFQSTQQYSHAPTSGRSSAGRPLHALVTFGFGGKLIMMKDTASFGNYSSASQNHSGYSLSVLNMSEVITEKADAQSLQPGTCDYFNSLCRQSLPGPLAGGSVGSKEFNKCLDDRISSSEFCRMDIRKSDALRQLLSLLRIACQYYGKLRSPFGTDPMLKENDLPGQAVANLFSSAKRKAAQYGAVSHCLQGLPSEAHLRATAAEVQSLLVSGMKNEALLCAQEGQLWGPALVLAAQLGDQFYIDTVKQLALRQLVAGTPLRTLSLLIAGQPADVFSTDTAASGSMPGVVSSPQQSMQLAANSMLDDWEDNLAVIASNRTKDDELVLIHLGDCLWRERADIFAAHICYLVAEANFEQYSDSARLCLVGADHLKFPRTYASPEAIQRTEIYEYSQVLGNSQFVLTPFQPYKLVYAHMLAEVGRLSDALKYCQAVQKLLKTGRYPEVETLRHVASSLEERIKTHQQGGFSSNLAPAKLVDKLFNLFDSTANRVIGGLPSSSSMTGGNPKGNEDPNQPTGPRVSTSQSTMAMSSLMPSASMEPISEWTGDGSRRPLHNRSVSEPDFSSAKDPSSMSDQEKAASRFGRFGFGSQLLQKTVGLVLKPRQDRQAKLGQSNKFYYNEELKRWVEEGAELPAQEAALPPPPPTSFQNGSGTANYNLKTEMRDDAHLSNGTSDYKSNTHIEHSSGMPPLPPTSNHFSARGRMGVRSRYVDTFNQGGGNPTNSFSSPSVPSVPSVRGAAGTNPKFFVPAPGSSTQTIPDNVEAFSPTDENPSVSTINGFSHPHESVPSVPMQKSPSMNNISSKNPTNGDALLSAHSRRKISWGGDFNDSRSHTNRHDLKPLGEVMSMSPPFTPNGSPLMKSSANSGSFGDELHEVEL